MKSTVCMLGAWLAAAVVLFAEDTERTFKAYPLQTPETGSLLEAAKSLLGEDGNIFYHRTTHQFLVSATTAGHERIAGMLAAANRPAPNVRIDIHRKETGRTVRMGGSVTPSGEITVTRTNITGRGHADVSIHANSVTQDEDMTQSLVVRSGSEGTFFVGEEVPFVQDLTRIGLQHGQLIGWGQVVDVPQVEWRSVGASLRLQATVLDNGPLVHIAITPELSGLVDDPADADRRGNLRRIRFSTMTTEVTVRDGQTISLGGLVKDRSFYEKFLIGVDHEGNQSNLDITLTPRINP